VKVARPQGIPEGTDVGVARSFTFNNLSFPSEGAYSFVVFLNNEVASRLRFAVRPRPS
jgi:hypothetical protein